jgi:hypothetical protein
MGGHELGHGLGQANGGDRLGVLAVDPVAAVLAGRRRVLRHVEGDGLEQLIAGDRLGVLAVTAVDAVAVHGAQAGQAFLDQDIDVVEPRRRLELGDLRLEVGDRACIGAVERWTKPLTDSNRPSVIAARSSI